MRIPLPTSLGALTHASQRPREWRPAPDDLVHVFNKALDHLPGAERRKMFGYPCAFINGHMFVGLFQEIMMLRLSEDDRSEFLKIGDAVPFEPMPGRKMKEYVNVPRSVLDSADDLGAWLWRSYTYARSLPPKPPKKKITRDPST